MVIPVGLGILGLEFAWARIWLKKAKAKAEDVGRNFKNGKPAIDAPAERTERLARQRPAAHSIGRSNISARAKRTGGDPYDSTLS